MEAGGIDATLGMATQLREALDDLEGRSRAFGSALTGALKGAVIEGDSLTEVLQGLALRLSSIALDSGLAPLQTALGVSVSGLTRSLDTSLASGGGTIGGGAASAAPASAAANASTHVVFNVQAADADSFRRSESQINAMLARAVGRGRRGN